MITVLMGVVGWVTGDSLTMEGFDKITRFLGIMFPGRHAAFENKNDKKYQMRKRSNMKDRSGRSAHQRGLSSSRPQCCRVLGVAQ